MKLRTVYRAGNALVFSIPPKMAAALHLTAGSHVAVAIVNRTLTVTRAGFVQETGPAAPTEREERAHE